MRATDAASDPATDPASEPATARVGKARASDAPDEPDTPAPARPRRRWLAGAPALLVVAVAAWEIVAALAAKAPDDADWARAAQVVRAGHRPGDLIVFAPGWADPIGRLHLGDLIPLEMAARMDGARYGRIWELSIRGGRAPEIAGLAPVETITAGGVEVRRYERAPVEVAADLVDRLATARIEGALRPPALELAEVGFAPHRCILVVPPLGKPVRITFSGLVGQSLVGYAGIADVFTRRDVRAPGRIEVEIGGRVVAAISPGVDDGWVRFSAELPDAPTDVTFAISAPVANRQLCFAAEVRR